MGLTCGALPERMRFFIYSFHKQWCDKQILYFLDLPSHNPCPSLKTWLLWPFLQYLILFRKPWPQVLLQACQGVQGVQLYSSLLDRRDFSSVRRFEVGLGGGVGRLFFLNRISNVSLGKTLRRGIIGAVDVERLEVVAGSGADVSVVCWLTPFRFLEYVMQV